jgi:glycosyltransferase involved in cell wall biosynthesis
MRIAINTRLLIKDKIDGIGKFTFEILKRIVNNNPEVEFHFIFDRPFSSDFIFNKNIIPHILPPATRHPVLWYFWVEFQLPRLLKKIQADVFFSPDGFIPQNCISPSIAVIHDINFEHFPNDLNWTHSIFYRYYFKKYANRANKIITVSNFSKNDIKKQYGIDDKKIDVVYNGVSEYFHSASNQTQLQIKEKYTNGKDFFLFIGSLHKRKNIKNLLLSFDQYKKNNGQSKLLIIGENKWLDKSTKKIHQKMNYTNDVIFLGRLKNSELVDVLGSAKALCFISLFEGFGLPIIEAMKCNVPVITSNTSCMPEIADNAAIIINPHSTEEISNAMMQIEKNPMTRKSLIKNGENRIKDFDWSKSANLIWKIIKSIN